MDREEQDIFYIEQYLENKLSQDERIAFEERIENDGAFRKLLEQTRALISGIAYSGRNKLLKELKDIEESLPEITIPQETKVVPIRKYRAWAVAACISLLILVSVLVVNSLNSGNEALYAAYYTPYPNIVYPIKRGDLERTNDREFAYQAYDLEDYERVITLFENMPEHELKAEDFLYLGNAYLATGSAEKAELCFKKLLKRFDNFSVQAKWYLSLSFLKQGESNASKALLMEIKSSQTSYSEKANELLQSMD